MVYAVDGVAFPVQPDVYMSVSSDQVVTGAQRTVGPWRPDDERAAGGEANDHLQVDAPRARPISPHQADADRIRTLSACGIMTKIRTRSAKNNFTAAR